MDLSELIIPPHCKCKCLFSPHEKVFYLVNGPGYQRWLHSGWLHMACAMSCVKPKHRKAYVAILYLFIFTLLTRSLTFIIHFTVLLHALCWNVKIDDNSIQFVLCRCVTCLVYPLYQYPHRILYKYLAYLTHSLTPHLDACFFLQNKVTNICWHFLVKSIIK